MYYMFNLFNYPSLLLFIDLSITPSTYLSVVYLLLQFTYYCCVQRNSTFRSTGQFRDGVWTCDFENIVN